MIDFNGMPTFLGLFYAKRLGNNIDCTFIFTFWVYLFFFFKFCTRSYQIRICFKEIYKILQLRFRAELGVMAMKWCFILSKSSEIEPFHQMQFSVIPTTPFFWSINRKENVFSNVITVQYSDEENNSFCIAEVVTAMFRLIDSTAFLRCIIHKERYRFRIFIHSSNSVAIETGCWCANHIDLFQ